MERRSRAISSPSWPLRATTSGRNSRGDRVTLASQEQLGLSALTLDLTNERRHLPGDDFRVILLQIMPA
jgi:hypothetical protein